MIKFSVNFSATKIVRLDAVIENSKVASLDIKLKHVSGEALFNYLIESLSFKFGVHLPQTLFLSHMFNVKISKEGELHSTEVAFMLLTQLSRV